MAPRPTESGTAVVVGAGIGGLATAVGLRRIGWQVRVLEQAPQLGEVGSGIALMANALRALDQLGVGADVAAGGIDQGTGGIRHASGRWLLRMDLSALAERLGTTIMVLHRAELHRILRGPLPDDAIRTGVQVTGVEQDGNGVTVSGQTATGTVSVEADLVVAADGSNSRIRSQWWPEHPGPRYTGSTAWRGVTPADAVPSAPPAQSWGPGVEFGLVPMVGGRLYWYAACNEPEGRRYADNLGEVRRRFGDWHAPIPAVLDATPPQTVLHHDLYELAEPLRTYARGRVVLLGDAAHAMTPNLGQGACQAIEDAVVLAAALGDEPSVDQAVRRYDGERRPRTQGVVRAARLAARLGQQVEHPLAVRARDALTWLTPARLSHRSMTRLADWRPPVLTPAR